MVYVATNESLRAIVSSLDPQPDDTIFAILGSGDQALALLEKARKVIAVDNYPIQIMWTRDRLNLLRAKEYEQFLNTRNSPENRYAGERDAYFSKFGFLDRIRDRLGDLEIINVDIYDSICSYHNLTKVYLSNAIKRWDANYFFKEFSTSIRIGGIVYATNHDLFRPGFLPSNFIMERNATRRARRFERSNCFNPKDPWIPGIYKK